MALPGAEDSGKVGLHAFPADTYAFLCLVLTLTG